VTSQVVGSLDMVLHSVDLAAPPDAGADSRIMFRYAHGVVY
jgi:hypothetical protein